MRPLNQKWRDGPQGVVPSNRVLYLFDYRCFLYALELDAGQFGNFKKIRRFMDLVISEKEILQDERLGFSEAKDKASLFNKYAYYAMKLNDQDFESKLEQCKRKIASEGIVL